MIKSIHIKNFKSVFDLPLELGAFNVLIGENGCGKSNILEAIAFGAAASADKLDYEFMGSRGIRVTNPEFMFSAFSNGKKKQSIKIDFSTIEKSYRFDLANEADNPKKWVNKNKNTLLSDIQNRVLAILFQGDKTKKNKLLEDFYNAKTLSEFTKQFKSATDFKEYFVNTTNLFPTVLEKFFFYPLIANYIVYSPEQSSLRKFEETTQMYPLGIKGEGLFQYLKELAIEKKNKKTLTDIKHNLLLLDWYEDF